MGVNDILHTKSTGRGILDVVLQEIPFKGFG